MVKNKKLKNNAYLEEIIFKKPKITKYKKKDSNESFIINLQKFSRLMNLDQICLNLVLQPNLLDQKEV